MHPADELGKTLSQARGIITSLINCFDRPKADFVTGAVFVSEALNAVEDLMSRATGNLTDLYKNYDLNALNVIADEQADDMADPEPNVKPVAVEPPVETRQPIFGRHSNISQLANKIEQITEHLPYSGEEEPVRPEIMADQPAKTYDELLEKLTAMADSAAFHSQYGEGEDDAMLPILEGLRADLIRVRSVA